MAQTKITSESRWPIFAAIKAAGASVESKRFDEVYEGRYQDVYWVWASLSDAKTGNRIMEPVSSLDDVPRAVAAAKTALKGRARKTRQRMAAEHSANSE